MTKLALILLTLGLQGCSRNNEFPTWAMPLCAFWVAVVSSLQITARETKRQWIADLVPIAITFWLAFTLAACSPTPAYALDMKRLREVICVRESRHLNSPVLAIGDGGESRGECQVSINTAQWITPHAINHGFVPAYLRTVSKDAEAFKWFLHYGPINRGLADAYLDWIKRHRRTRDVAKLAYLWNAGHNSDGSKAESWAFADEVRIMYLGPPRASVKPITLARR